MNARSGPGTDDAPRGNEGLSSNCVTAGRLSQFATDVRRMPAPTPRPVIAFATTVLSARRVPRTILVWRCDYPSCPPGTRHLSVARGELPPVLERRGPHGPVRLVIVAQGEIAE